MSYLPPPPTIIVVVVFVVVNLVIVVIRLFVGRRYVGLGNACRELLSSSGRG
jgi:hypothetical protein